MQKGPYLLGFSVMGEGVVKSLPLQISATERPVVYTRPRNKKLSLYLPMFDVTRHGFVLGVDSGLGIRLGIRYIVTINRHQ